MAISHDPERSSPPTSAKKDRPRRHRGPPHPPYRGIEDWPPGQGYYVQGIGDNIQLNPEDSDFGREFDTSYGPGDTFDGQEREIERRADRSAAGRITRYGGRIGRQSRSA